MGYLTGTVYHQMDAKNRIRIPAKFKSAFPKDEPLYFFRYVKGRIAVMPESVLQEKVKMLKQNVNPFDPKVMEKMSVIQGLTEELTEDTQGRTCVPLSVRKFAGLKKDVISVGMEDYIEIWDQEAYEALLEGYQSGDAITALLQSDQ